MNKNGSILILAILLSLIFVTPVQSRDLQPEYRIGNLFCYAGWTGDTAIAAHIILTDKPLDWQNAIDEATTRYKFKPDTKFIEIEIEDSVPNPGWEVSYNNEKFFQQHREQAIECLKKINGQIVRKYPVKKLKKKK